MTEMVALTAIQPPKQFLCPISLEIMRDPVLASDEQTYDKASLVKWLQTNNTSPVTREPLGSEFRRSHALRQLIEDWLKLHKQPGVEEEESVPADAPAGSGSPAGAEAGLKSTAEKVQHKECSNSTQADSSVAVAPADPFTVLLIGDNRQQLAAAVPGLIAHLLRMPLMYTRPYTASVLEHLATEQPCQLPEAAAAMPALAKLLNSSFLHDKPTAQQVSAATPALLSFLRHPSPAYRSLGILAAYLLADANMQTSMAAAALPALASLLQDASHFIRAWASNAIMVMASHDSLRAPVAAAALPRLVANLQDPSRTALPSAIIQARDCAAITLSHLTLPPALRGPIAHAALPALISYLQDADWPAAARVPAVCCLQHLAATHGLAQPVADAALPLLVQVLQDTSSQDEETAALQVLRSLAETGDDRLRACISAAAGTPLVRLAYDSSNSNGRIAAKQALKMLRGTGLPAQPCSAGKPESKQASKGSNMVVRAAKRLSSSFKFCGMA